MMLLMWLETCARWLGLGRPARQPEQLRRWRGEAIVRLPAWRGKGTGRLGGVSKDPTACSPRDRVGLPYSASPGGARPSISPRPLWIRVDPRERGHAALSGRMVDVCAALERLAAAEESRA